MSWKPPPVMMHPSIFAQNLMIMMNQSPAAAAAAAAVINQSAASSSQSAFMSDMSHAGGLYTSSAPSGGNPSTAVGQSGHDPLAALHQAAAFQSHMQHIAPGFMIGAQLPPPPPPIHPPSVSRASKQSPAPSPAGSEGSAAGAGGSCMLSSTTDVKHEVLSPAAGGGSSPSPGGSEAAENKNVLMKPDGSGAEICLVCGDKASGFHYNALTCEGCKVKLEAERDPNMPPLRSPASYKPGGGANCSEGSDEMPQWQSYHSDDGGSLTPSDSLGDPGGGGVGSSGGRGASSPVIPRKRRRNILSKTGGGADVLKCQICGDGASGYHYNALSCEGCKGFFRRSITKNAVYKCTRGGSCEMDMYMRRKCQECRLKKCREVGMLPECLLTPEQCRSKRQRKMLKQQHSGSNGGGGSLAPPPPLNPLSDSLLVASNASNIPSVPPGSAPGYASATGGGGGSSSGPPRTAALTPVGGCSPFRAPGTREAATLPPTLDEDQANLIKRIMHAKRTYSYPSEEDIKKVTPWPGGGGGDDLGPQFSPQARAQMRFQHMTEITILCVQAIVEFTKRIPGFLSLDRKDQIILLKTSAIEVLMLHTAQYYDSAEQKLLMATGVRLSREDLSQAGLHDFVEPMFDFARSMSELRLDEVEYSLIIALCILASDRSGLTRRDTIEKLQEPYLETLRVYLKQRRPHDNLILPKMLMKLTELRSINNQHSEYLFGLKLRDQDLPPLLNEIWDQ